MQNEIEAIHKYPLPLYLSKCKNVTWGPEQFLKVLNGKEFLKQMLSLKCITKDRKVVFLFKCMALAYETMKNVWLGYMLLRLVSPRFDYTYFAEHF